MRTPAVHLPLVPKLVSEPESQNKVLKELKNFDLKTGTELSRDLSDLPEEEAFSTGLPPLDRLLSGGLPRGHLVELMGHGTSGRFSCVLSLLAATTQRGEAVALVDLGDQLDPRTAESFGVDLTRLLWIRPQRVSDALSAAEILLAGSFPVIVLELGLPPVPGGRGRQVWWVRLARAIRRHRSALLVASPYPVSASTASIVLESQRLRFLWRGTEQTPRLLSGLEMAIERGKSRHHPRPGAGEFRLQTVSEYLLHRKQPKPTVAPLPQRSTKTDISLPETASLPTHLAQPVLSTPVLSTPVLSTPNRPRPRVGTHPNWGYRRPAILPEVADRVLVQINEHSKDKKSLRNSKNH